MNRRPWIESKPGAGHFYPDLANKVGGFSEVDMIRFSTLIW